jgi:hypothetical protein
MEYGIALVQVGAEASVAVQQSKRSRSKAGQERALPVQRRYRNCGKVGHNTRTCQNDEETSSNLNTSISDIELNNNVI